MQAERMDTVLAAEGLGKQVSSPEGTLAILSEVSFRVLRGESVAIMGASGAGKSTLLALLAGLDEEVREVLLLKVREGRTYREIASITGLSLHKVSASIHLGLRRLSVGLRQAGLA